jgi:hypothetical protein
MSTQRRTHSQTAADPPAFRRWFATQAPGREQPSGPASGRQWVRNRGVAHAPAPSVTPAKCVSCAAQNAALVVLPLNLQVVNHRSLSRPPSRRQPFQSRRLKTRAGRRSENRVGRPPKYRQDLTVSSCRGWAATEAMTLFKRGVSDLGCGRGHDRRRGQISWSLTPRLPSVSPRRAALNNVSRGGAGDVRHNLGQRRWPAKRPSTKQIL